MAFLPEPIKLSIQAQLELVYGSRSGCFTRSTGIFEVSGNSHTGHHHPQHLVGDQVRQRGVVCIYKRNLMAANEILILFIEKSGI